MCRVCPLSDPAANRAGAADNVARQSPRVIKSTCCLFSLNFEHLARRLRLSLTASSRRAMLLALTGALQSTLSASRSPHCGPRFRRRSQSHDRTHPDTRRSVDGSSTAGARTVRVSPSIAVGRYASQDRVSVSDPRRIATRVTMRDDLRVCRCSRSLIAATAA